MITILAVGIGGFVLGLITSKVMSKSDASPVKTTDAEVKKESDKDKSV